MNLIAEEIKCPKCGAKSVKSGKHIRRGGKVQAYKCTVCGHSFTEDKIKRTAIIGNIVVHPKSTAEKGETITV